MLDHEVLLYAVTYVKWYDQLRRYPQVNYAMQWI